MSGLSSWYPIWIILVIACAILFRGWYARSAARSQMILWVAFFLVCPPIALVAYLVLKQKLITITLRKENSSHG